MSDNKINTVPIRELCPICANEIGKSVLMKTDPTETEKKASKDGGKIIWGKPCDSCSDLRKRGFVLIGAVESKTTDTTNPYRSGNVWCVEWEVAEELFKPHGAPKSGVAFVDINVAQQMKLPGVNMNA